MTSWESVRGEGEAEREDIEGRFSATSSSASNAPAR